MSTTERQFSIATRLAVWFALVAFVGLCLISAMEFLVLQRELDRHQMEQIESRMADMHYMLMHARAPGVGERAKAKIEALTPSDGRSRIWMWSEDPDYCYGNDLNAVLTATRQAKGLADLRTDGHRMRVFGEDLPATPNRPALRLMVGLDYQPFAKTLHSVVLALVGLTLLGTVAVATAGYWVARRGLLPVKRISEQAHRIEPGNPAQRLSLPSMPHELADLGAAFNAALDRLDAAYRHLATFNDNVAHELRTPLANLIGQTQVALSRERESARLREVLQSNLEELERLRSIVADMLFLARAEQGARASELVCASLAQEVAKTLEFVEVLLDDAGMHVQVQGDAQVPVQIALFRRAMTNLLHNALQHSLPGSTIAVHIVPVAHGVEIRVENPGAPLSAQHLPHLFDRFYRVEEARAKSGESHGLGLAIVKAVAQMHGGQVFAESVKGQNCFGFCLPIGTAPQA